MGKYAAAIVGQSRERWTLRFIGDNQRTYAELLRAEMDRRELKYTPINLYE